MSFGLQLAVRKTSTWTFKTSGTGGLSFGFVAGGEGHLILVDPAGNPRVFSFAAGGAALGWGLRRIPKLGPILDPKRLSEKGSVVGAPESFWNHGIVYIMNGFEGDELGIDDFVGVCCLVDVGASLVAGYSGSVFLLNVNPLAVAALASPATSVLGPSLNPTAMVLTRGWNVGFQASVGIVAETGYLWREKTKP